MRAVGGSVGVEDAVRVGSQAVVVEGGEVGDGSTHRIRQAS